MPDCIVVGGGVIGLLTARELHLAGADVLLLERGPLGGESSWAGGGIISPLYPWRYAESVNALAERSKSIYSQLSQVLEEESGIDCELLSSGLFTVTSPEAQIDDWLRRWSVDGQYVTDTADILAIEPRVGPGVDQGLWLPEVMQIRNPRLVKALIGSFAFHKIAYAENSPVEELIVHGDKVAGVKTASAEYRADKVIISSGAWSAQFTETRDGVDVVPVKGQMIMYKGAPDLIRRIVLSEGHYVIPRRDGRVLAGSTLEKIGFDKQVSQAAMDELHQAAIDLVPALDGLTIERQWAGLRPGTEKGIPYICAHDRVDGLYIHAGHYRNGIVLGAASAQLMADIIMARETTWCDVGDYALGAAH